MSRLLLLLLGVLCAGAWRPEAGRAAALDPGAEVLRVFASKCAACHGADLARPKGRFGYVLDLARVAANPELVVPRSPDESELWILVKRGEMPPADARTGALSAEQKETIRAWIAAGAPPAADATPDLTAVTAATAEAAAEPAAVSRGRHFLDWVGRFHLLVLHFPIALALTAAVGEFWSVVRRSHVPEPAVRFCLLLAATSAVSTVALGWLHALAGNGAGLPRILTAHRWLGTVAGLVVIAAAVLAARDARRGVRSRLGRGCCLPARF